VVVRVGLIRRVAAADDRAPGSAVRWLQDHDSMSDAESEDVQSVKGGNSR